MNRHDYPLMLDVSQAAEVMAVHENTVYEMVKRDELPHIRVGAGSHIRFPRDRFYRHLGLIDDHEEHEPHADVTRLRAGGPQ